MKASKGKWLALLICCSLLVSCNAENGSDADSADISETSSEASAVIADLGYSDEDKTMPLFTGAVEIVCKGHTVEINGAGASADNGNVTISNAGIYSFSGKLEGSVTVEAEKKDTVNLIFNNISIQSENTAPVNIKKAKKVIITMADNSENSLSDSGDYIYDDIEEQEPSAAIFSKSDLSFNGDGILNIKTSFNDGICSKDVLRIAGGQYIVESKDDGIIGRDAVLIDGAKLRITAGGDGIKATNDEDTSLGYINIFSGNFTVNAAADGIQAETEIIADGGTFVITTGGGSANASYSSNGGFNDGWGRWPTGDYAPASASSVEASSDSAKALKAGSAIKINGGVFDIDSSDDSIHSNGNVTVSGGVINSKSGDDGIHADSTLTVNGGSITIAKSYEGLEACDIIIGGGVIDVTAADDGLNGAGGNDFSSVMGRPGANGFSKGNATFKMMGGELTVSASGDGIDINGSATVDGGTVCVFGPTDGGNGILDYDSSFEISGGTFIALGASGMLQSFTGGEQASVACTMPNIPAGASLVIENRDGNEILSIEARKQFSALVFSSAELQVGESYTVFYEYNGEKTELGSFTQSSLTMGGSGSGHPGGGRPGGAMPGGYGY